MTGSTVDSAAIALLVPHSGSMRLIDEVVAWDTLTIHCRTLSHLSPAHPLRSGGGLGALHLVEYGAQAMAIHGGLEARSRGGSVLPGMLASVRDLRLQVERIDDLGAALDLHARQLLAREDGWLYEFSASCGARTLATGRVIVMLGKP